MYAGSAACSRRVGRKCLHITLLLICRCGCAASNSGLFIDVLKTEEEPT